MRKSLLIGTALLLTTVVVGVAVASREIPLPGHHERGHRALAADEAGGAPVRVADRSEREDHGEQHYGRRHHRDDDDDDDDDDDEVREGRGRERLPQTGPADPNAPVPDNGLFNNKARPQVEVR